MKIAVLPGDGIGKEVVPVAVDVLKVVMPEAEYVPIDVGQERFLREGTAMSEEDIDRIKSCNCILFGAITTPPKKCYKSVILSLRTMLDMYANVRPFKSCAISPYQVDFTIYRENCEDLYCGMEDVKEDEVLSTRKITRHASERIAKAACLKPDIKKLTIVHKANVLRSCELFRDVCIGVANEMKVPYEEMLVDAMAYGLIRNPSRFDTIVTTNLFGDILSDEAAALIGGLGLSPEREHRRQVRAIRARPWQCPRHRGPGHRKPDSSGVERQNAAGMVRPVHRGKKGRYRSGRSHRGRRSDA